MSLASSIRDLLQLRNRNEQPNVNELWLLLRDFQPMKYSLKQDGYRLGRELFGKLKQAPIPVEADPNLILRSKPSTQLDIEAPWFRYWCHKLSLEPLPHRKLWEFAYVMQNFFSLGKLVPGSRAIGFGCGSEPLPSYFASIGMSVTVTDLEPKKVVGMGWAETGQHLASLESAYVPGLVDRQVFENLVSIRYVDMNDIPKDIKEQYDLCWSICALEHLGSIKLGLDFIRNSLACLRHGGVAIHTTEFNYSRTTETTDNWQTVLFLRKHFEELADSLRNEGYEVQPLDFDVGSLPLDCFVDLPPYTRDASEDVNLESFESDGFKPGHLKLSIDGFPATCFGITIRKK